MLNIHGSLRSASKILSEVKNKKERTQLLELFQSLNNDTKRTLDTEFTKKMKGLSVRVVEIVKGNMRIFYVPHGNDITIVYVLQNKQKNKTESQVLEVVEKRAKEVQKNLK